MKNRTTFKKVLLNLRDTLCVSLLCTYLLSTTEWNWNLFGIFSIIIFLGGALYGNPQVRLAIQFSFGKTERAMVYATVMLIIIACIGACGETPIRV